MTRKGWFKNNFCHQLASRGIKTKECKTSNKIKHHANPMDYFKTTENSFIVPISALVKEHEPSEEKKDKARRYMILSSLGTNKDKRDPIKVWWIPRTKKYLVIDGNTTTTVAPEFGLKELIAEEEFK
jgi:hypothetical protein